MDIIKDKYYTAYEVAKAKFIKKKGVDGKLSELGYDAIYKIFIRHPDELNIVRHKRKNLNRNYVLGEDLIKFIENNPKYYN